MPGPIPKDPATRQRRNKAATAAELPAAGVAFGHELPKGDWHQRTRDFWRRIWASPMATRYVEADLDGLYVLAGLMDQWHVGPQTPMLAAEIRLQRVPYGLTPIDRNRLQWKIEPPAAKPAEPQPEQKRPAFDPRKVLEMKR